ncbi:hypothetical protein BTO18_04965 [Polaribacter porphyrae]|uniref:Uncharacterized protein n=1 Tax=Polaribacter porphyrae TaxID=1137780 RepID=A0A2S7WTJ6_9FLAO|nr:hypothetical protein BTO18_04965 [Polaribacter porphyrae]
MCNTCKTYALTFNNVFFQFTKEQLYKFKVYVSQIDVDYWLDYNSCSAQKRKIPIPTSHQNLVLIFDIYELKALRILLGIDLNGFQDEIIEPADIDYPLILN